MNILVSYRGIPNRTAFGQSFAAAFRMLGHEVQEYFVDYGGPRDFRDYIVGVIDLIVYLEMNDEMEDYYGLGKIDAKKVYIDYDVACDRKTEQVIKGIGFDYIFTGNESYIPWFQNLGVKNVLFSHGAYDHARLFPIPGVVKSGVAFIGHYHEERARFFEHVSERLGFSIPQPVLYEDKYREGINKLLIHLNMNDVNPGMIVTRVHETLGCATVLLTYYTDGVEKAYKPGEEFVIYRDENDCAEKIKELMANPDLCSSIARRGYEAALFNNTFLVRARQILEVVK